MRDVHCFVGQTAAAASGFALELRSYDAFSLLLQLSGGADVPLVDIALSSSAAATPDLPSAVPPIGDVYEERMSCDEPREKSHEDQVKPLMRQRERRAHLRDLRCRFGQRDRLRRLRLRLCSRCGVRHVGAQIQRHLMRPVEEQILRRDVANICARQQTISGNYLSDLNQRAEPTPVLSFFSFLFFSFLFFSVLSFSFLFFSSFSVPQGT